MKFGEMPPMYVPPRPSGIEARVPEEPPEWYLEAERTLILCPSVEGHRSEWVNEDGEDGDWAAIECECGWREFCSGFDAGAIAACAYEDHLESASSTQPDNEMETDLRDKSPRDGTGS